MKFLLHTLTIVLALLDRINGLRISASGQDQEKHHHSWLRELENQQSSAFAPSESGINSSIVNLITRIAIGSLVVIFLLVLILQFFWLSKLNKMILSVWTEFLQGTQLVGVYLFLPVIWKGKMLETLYFLYSIGEYVKLDKPIILSSDSASATNSTVTSGTDGKTSLYIPTTYINSIYPISSLLLMAVLLADGVVFILALFIKS